MIKKFVLTIMACLILGMATAEAAKVTSVRIWKNTTSTEAGLNAFLGAVKTSGWFENGKIHRDAIGGNSFDFAKDQRLLRQVSKQFREPKLFGVMMFLEHGLVDSNGFVRKSITPAEFVKIGQGKGWNMPINSTAAAKLASASVAWSKMKAQANKPKAIVSAPDKYLSERTDQLSAQQRAFERQLDGLKKQQSAQLKQIRQQTQERLSLLEEASGKTIDELIVLKKGQSNLAEKVAANNTSIEDNSSSLVGLNGNVDELSKKLDEQSLPFGYTPLAGVLPQSALDRYATYREWVYFFGFVLVACILILLMQPIVQRKTNRRLAAVESYREEQEKEVTGLKDQVGYFEGLVKSWLNQRAEDDSSVSKSVKKAA